MKAVCAALPIIRSIPRFTVSSKTIIERMTLQEEACSGFMIFSAISLSILTDSLRSDGSMSDEYRGTYLSCSDPIRMTLSNWSNPTCGSRTKRVFFLLLEKRGEGKGSQRV